MTIKIDVLSIDDRSAEFIVEGVHPSFVNALRRVLLAEVPKLAIENVTFYDNTSALFDEIIAHRLGLVPIPTDPSTLNLAGKTDDEGNPSYLVRYTLTKEGPSTVYSGDLECEDSDFEIQDKEIPLVELLDGQRLILEATAILGRGVDHAKWQVCSGVGYKYYPTANIDHKKYDKAAAQKFVDRTPAGILAVDGDKIQVLQEHMVNKADDIENSRILGEGAFDVEYDDRKFLFKFETDGSLKAEDALLKGVEILKERFQEFGDEAGSL